MDWADIQAQVGLISAHGQVAMLASFRRDAAAVTEALKQVEQALKKVEALTRAGQD